MIHSNTISSWLQFRFMYISIGIIKIRHGIAKTFGWKFSARQKLSVLYTVKVKLGGVNDYNNLVHFVCFKFSIPYIESGRDTPDYGHG